MIGNELLLGIATALAVTVPLAWKWQLGVKRVTVFVVAIGLVCGETLHLLGLTWSGLADAALVAGATLGIATGFLAYRFYRDPERSCPFFAGAICSPADGTVIYVRRSEGGQLPVTTKHGRHCQVSELLKTPFYSCDAWVVGISMSLLDVHVNRAPISGTILFQQRFPGGFGSLRSSERILDNERATTVIQAEGLQVAVVQIASRLVRRIVPYVKVMDNVTLGQRIGAIRLGSQVDLVLPVRGDLQVLVQVGDYLLAGESIVAKCNKRVNKHTRDSVSAAVRI